MRKSNMAELKRLSGLGNSYTEWRRPLSESVSQKVEKKTAKVPAAKPKASSAKPVSLNEMRIKRMANMLTEERYGGRHAMQFDEERIERLMIEAEQSQDHKALVHHHWNARYATAAAHEADKAGDSQASYNHHKHAAAMHAAAAQHMAAAGDNATARTHAQWAQHHEKHAAGHAQAMANLQHASKHELPAAPAHKALPAKKGSEPEHELHSKRAHQASRLTAHLHDDPQTSHQELAMAHKDASHENMHAALSHFHRGDHERAMTHFNTAIHHANQSKEHDSAMRAKKAHADRVAAGGGPRAQVGMAHV
jgi:hypothetical protein